MKELQGSAELSVSELITAWEKCQRAVEEIGGLADIDEMSVMFDSPNAVLSYVSQVASLPGCALFNYAEDTVTTRPIPGSYRVQYWFLKIPAKFRIEVLRCSAGSPLHTSLASVQQHDYEPMAVHASFKCVNEEDYVRALARLRTAGWECWQRCDSSYGKFSYWGNEDEPLGWLLKPRVNLRDGSSGSTREA